MPAGPELLVVDTLQGMSRALSVAPHTIAPAHVMQSPDVVMMRLAAWQADFVGGQTPATVRAVRADWGQYIAWCEGTGQPALPASLEQVEAFLRNAIVRGRKRSTVQRYLYTIGLIHDAAGLTNPVKDKRWKDKWKKLIKELKHRGGLTAKQAAAMEAADIVAILATLGESPRDLRDAAMLALASDTLLRESELVAVRVEHFAYNRTKNAWTLYVPFSKANQDGKDEDYRYVHGPTMTRVQRWMAAASITQGFVFLPVGGRPKAPPAEDDLERLPAPAAFQQPRAAPPRPAEALPLGAQEVARIFRRRALAAGLDHAPRISGHSARIGTANDLINAGKTTAQIQHAGGWRSAEMVNRYTRRSQAGVNAVAELRGHQPPTHDPEPE